jgi:titin
MIPNLTNGVTYNFRATAFLGGYSNGHPLTESNLESVICGTPPDAPTNLVGVVSTSDNVISQEIDLSWTASVSDVNYPVQHYNIFYSLDQNGTYIQVQTDGAVTNYSLTGLSNGETYYIYVTAVNQIGESVHSDTITAVPLKLSSPPQNLQVNFDPNTSDSGAPHGYQSVDLSWSAPSDDGGSDIISYNIQYSLDPTFTNNVFSVTSNITTDSIHNASIIIPYASRVTSTGWYYFQVCATNSIGNGAYTSATTIMADAIPNQVSNLTSSNLDADGNHADGNITLSWGYAIDNTTPLLGYVIAYLDESSVMQSLFVNNNSVSPSYTISGLQNGYSYDFSVMEINMKGAGDVSDITQIPSTPAYPPDVEISHGDQTIFLNWDYPDDRGNAVTGYNVYKSLDDVTYSIISSNQSDLSYEDDGLINGTTYYYKVSSINDNGEGNKSDSVSDYPSKVPDTPNSSAITLVNSNASSSGQQLTIHWVMNPASLLHDGGSPITSFDILNEAGDQVVGNVVSDLNNSNYSFVILNLINGQNYKFNVRAINRDGAGAMSLSPQGKPSGLPDAPHIVQTYPKHTDGAGQQIVIQWAELNVASGGTNTHPSDEGSAVQHYKIYRDNV